jgi:hypothetical protein
MAYVHRRHDPVRDLRGEPTPDAVQLRTLRPDHRITVLGPPDRDALDPPRPGIPDHPAGRRVQLPDCPRPWAIRDHDHMVDPPRDHGNESQLRRHN